MARWLDDWEKGTGGAAMDPGQPYSGYTNRSSIHTVLRRACDPEKAALPRMALYACVTGVRRS